MFQGSFDKLVHTGRVTKKIPDLPACGTEASDFKQQSVSSGNMPEVSSALCKTPKFLISSTPELSSCYFS